MVCAVITAVGVLLGVAVGRASAGKTTRGILKSTIKGGYATGRVIKAVATEAKEEISDLAARAKAEINDLAKDEKVNESGSGIVVVTEMSAAPKETVIVERGVEAPVKPATVP